MDGGYLLHSLLPSRKVKSHLFEVLGKSGVTALLIIHLEAQVVDQCADLGLLMIGLGRQCRSELNDPGILGLMMKFEK